MRYLLALLFSAVCLYGQTDLPFARVQVDPMGPCDTTAPVRLNLTNGKWWACIVQPPRVPNGPVVPYSIWINIKPPANAILVTATDPTGQACAANSMLLWIPSGSLYTCASGVYAIGGGGGSGTLAGDVTGPSGANTVVKVNNGIVPASAAVIGTNSSSQPIAESTTGTGAVVLSTSPSLVTPALGTPSSGNGANLTGIPPSAVTATQGNGEKFQLSTGTTTTNDCLKYDAAGNAVDSGAGCGSGSGSVTSVATTGPITGGTITTTGTIACATCVTSSSPGAGVAHFAGSTQAVTSSAIAPADLSSVQGNGTKVQLSTGTTTTNDCVKYDANGNTVDSGGTCSAGSSSDPIGINPIVSDFAAGVIATTTGNITSSTNSLSVASATGWTTGMGIAVAGAAAAGAELVCPKVTVSGTTFTLFQSDGVTACNASTTVTGGVVNHDDTLAISSAITAMMAAQTCVHLATGNYNITSGLTTMSSPSCFLGDGPGQSIIWNRGKTADIFTITYEITGGTGSVNKAALIRGFQISQASGITPTNGFGFNVHSASGAGHYVAGLHIEDVQLNNIWGGVTTGTGVIADWFDNLYMFDLVGGNGIYVDSVSPSGDLHWSAIEMNGANTGVTVNNSDTQEFTDLKTNGAGVTINASSFGVRFINPSIEGPDTNTGCGVTVASGSGNHSEPTEFIGGGIGLWANSFCGTFNTGNVNVIGTNLYSTGNTAPSAILGATPILGTPASGTLTNATGLPISTGVSGLGTGVASAMASAVSGSGGICLSSGSSCAGAAGGGTSGWSGIAASLLTTATQYAPFVGGGTTSGTAAESTVQVAASAAATITNLKVSLNAAVGASATVTVTLRDASSGTTLTCVTASGGTSCSDTTHSVNIALGDLVDFQIVATGTVTAATPNIVISYAVGTSGVGITSVNGSTGPTIQNGVLASIYVDTAQSTNSTTYTDLSTADTVTFTLNSTTNIVITYIATESTDTNLGVSNNIANIDGTNVTVNNNAVVFASSSVVMPGVFVYRTSLASGSHTIKIEHKVTGVSTGTWQSRLLTVAVTS